MRQGAFSRVAIVLDSNEKISDNLDDMNEQTEGRNKKKLHKLIGAGIGWVVAGPVGAALGLLVGHTVENNPDLLQKLPVGHSLKPHYDVLEVPYDAEEDQVKSAYKRLAQKYHPDRFAGADAVVEELAREKMSKINDAYRTIKQAMKKQ
jgi:DnaJ-domain-containing protein 1